MLTMYNMLMKHCEEDMEECYYLNEMVSITYFPNLNKACIKYRKFHTLVDAKSLDEAYLRFKRDICYYSVQAMMIEEQIEREINHELTF